LDTTLDKLLGGRVQLRQPKTGYRAAVDPVLLAAAVTARPGQTVLELGCGVGAAMLCLAVRVKGLEITGIELQEDYLTLAQLNTDYHTENATFHLKQSDARHLSQDIPANSFDQVMANPPYHDAQAYDPGDDDGKTTAHAMSATDLAAWVKTAHGRLQHRGVLTMIYRADGLPELLTAMAGKFGGITVLPLWPKDGVAAKRVLVRGSKDSNAPFVLLGGLALHGKNGDYMPDIQAILRDATAIAW
jgi:tRNA1(Val) A37 N6-methylase TrmN6